MRILHTIESLSKNRAGLFYFLNDLASRQRELGYEVIVAGPKNKAGQIDAHLWRGIKTEFVDVMGLPFLPFERTFEKVLARVKPDLIHCHGLWTFHSLAVPSYCRRTNTPFLVSPHGMLEPWAWKHHAWKKRPIWWLWEERFLSSASVLHATADQECRNLDTFSFKKPKAIVPVGVELPKLDFQREKSDTNTALFFSRIHPKKGLLDLVQAWSIVRPKGWRMVIAGPDCDGHLAVVKNAVRELNLDQSFEFQGPVYDSAKWRLFQSADLFILPTYSENFGIVIAEALASGVPVITTKETPWNELTKCDCGWWIALGVEHLSNALRSAFSLSDEQRRNMGLRGRKLVEAKYSWDLVTSRMSGVYDWVTQRGPKPQCVKGVS